MPSESLRRLVHRLTPSLQGGLCVAVRWMRIVTAMVSVLLGTFSFGAGIVQEPPEVADVGTTANSGRQWDFQFDLFQMLLEEQGARVVAWQDAWQKPSESVIVLAGNLESMPRRPRTELIRFVEAGGRILLATERGFSSSQIGSIKAGPVSSTDRQYQYQAFQDCLSLSATSGANVLADVNQVVLNRSGWFLPNVDRLQWETLLELPNNCWPYPSRNQPVLAIGRSNSGGLVVVSSDASLFTNGMLWHGDNAVVAIRLADVLTESAGQRRQDGTQPSGSTRRSLGNRTKLAFMVDGRILGSFRDRLPRNDPQDGSQTPPALPEPTLERALRLGNIIAKEVAASNIINESLMQQPRRLAASRYFQGLLFFAALLFLIGALLLVIGGGNFRNRFLRIRRMQRSFELRDAQSDDFRIPAGHLAREFCCELTGSDNSAEWQSYWNRMQQGATPKFRKADFQSLIQILDVASRGYQSRLGASEFQEFGRKVEKLRAEYLKPQLTS